MTTAIIDPDLSASQTLQIVQGSVADWVLQVTNRDGSSPAFASGDTVAAELYQGQSQTLLVAPTAIWTGGTGYSTGSVQVSPTSAQTATLEADGEYSLQLWWTSADASRTACVLRAAVQVLPAPGSTTQAIQPYNSLADMLRWAGWIMQVQARDTDGEGFCSQRLQAREWMDWAVINNYRGASIGNFETHSTLAFNFGGGVGWRRGTGPSPSLITWLASNYLILRPQIVEACAYKAISIIGLNQIGINNQQAAYGCYFRDMAERVLARRRPRSTSTATGSGRSSWRWIAPTRWRHEREWPEKKWLVASEYKFICFVLLATSH